jgi:hypothetical protein
VKERDMNSRLMQAVQCMFECCPVEHGPLNPSDACEANPAKARRFGGISDLVWRSSYSLKRA